VSRTRVYLDHNATAPLREEARAAMLAALDEIGNPSSVHAEGRRARTLVETAREQVARLVGAAPAEVVFTSGATEANAWALSGDWDTIIAAGIEHDSILAPARAARGTCLEVGAGLEGIADVPAAAAHVLSGRARGRTLLCLQMANNETGVVQPVAQAVRFAQPHDVSVHTDAVQAVGRIEIDFSALGVDTMSLSAHKIGGPKGVGALIVREGTARAPLIAGSQERRRRGGTENVAGIAAFGAAAAAAAEDLQRMRDVRALRDQLESEVRAVTPQAVIVGAEAERLANTSVIAMPGLRAETAVIRLDLAGIAVSAGAACSSGKVGASHVLAAMGTPAPLARAAIRVSLGTSTCAADVAAFITAWRDLNGTSRQAEAANASSQNMSNARASR